MKLTSLIGAAAIAFALPMAAQAATISSNSQLDISGLVTTGSQFTPTGFADFDPNGGYSALQATGDFDALVNDSIEAGADTQFTFTDIDFTMPGVIFSGGGITFTASSFMDFDNTDPGRGFMARGIVSATGFEDTEGFFDFSTQGNAVAGRISFSSTTTVVPLPASVLMLLAALGGLGVVSRRSSAA